jgi:hypothetical protein
MRGDCAVCKASFFPEYNQDAVHEVQAVHCKKGLPIFPFPAGWMSLTKLSLTGNFLISDIPSGDGKSVIFLRCIIYEGKCVQYCTLRVKNLGLYIIRRRRLENFIRTSEISTFFYIYFVTN